MGSKRAAIVDSVAAQILALRDGAGAQFLGSVNKFARAPTEVNDQPSIDVFVDSDRSASPPINSGTL